ncbi:MAG: hypothetical protein Tsb0014_44200 [Pleurocapsa sp.]
MWYQSSLKMLFFSSYLWSSYKIPPLLAQIIPDNSLGSENSIVTPNVTVKEQLVDLIEGGAIRGNNLFHSFEQFSIGNGAKVYFANPDGIENILTRVTGNNLSEIFGTLGVNGGANLFLLNPNGIVFGKNAALDVNGSFLATTAESYIFENGFAYSASNPDAPPLLSINIPLGLQFGSNSAAIEVQGQGSNLILNPFTFEFLFREQRPTGLEVPSQNTLALIGGAINLTGGNLTASQGRIEIGSIAKEGNVFLTPTEDGWTFDYQNITNFDNINLTQSASIDVSGSGGGNIQLQGKNIALLDSSAIISSTSGKDNGGTIQISAAETFNLLGTEGGLLPSGIFNQVEASATGNGSKLNLEADTVKITNNALINSSVAGAGNGGEVEIKARELSLNGSLTETSSLIFFPTGILSLVSFAESATGKSSNLTVAAEKIEMTNGALIATATFSAGDSGDIVIKTDALELSGTGSFLLFPDNPFPSGIFTTVAADLMTGNGGNITIETRSLKISDGGQIRSGTLGLGNSGDISIQAQEILISDRSLLLDIPVASGIFSSSGLGILTGEVSQTTGNGGDITVETENLTLTGGGQIGAGTSSTGKSGNLAIKAQDIKISGQLLTNPNESLTGFADTSGLFTSVVRADALGNGGDIVVETENLEIVNGGAIAANVFGKGEGGNIQINASKINLSESFFVSDVRSGITTTVEATGTGNAGNIKINADSLNLTEGGSLAASSLGNANAGDINLQVIELNLTGVFLEGELFSQISAFSESDFSAGTINLTAENVTLRDHALISVSNLSNGDSGNLNLRIQELILNDGASLEAQVNAGSQGNLNLTTNNITLRNNSKITSQATGTATGGNITISNQDNLVLLDNSQIIADAVFGNGGKINITTVGLFISADSLISASSEYGLDGTVEIEEVSGDRKLELNQLPVKLIDASQQITTGCSLQNNFVISGKGGLPENPTQNLRSQTVWQDIRLLKLDSVQTSYSKQSLPIVSSKPPIVQEANALQVNSQGNLELIANQPTSIAALTVIPHCWTNYKP